MALYGFFVSAPLGHYLTGSLQRAFRGKVGAKYRFAQLLASNLLVAPIQTVGESESPFPGRLFGVSYGLCSYGFEAFLASMAIINGAKSLDQVVRTVKGGFLAVIRVCFPHSVP